MYLPLAVSAFALAVQVSAFTNGTLVPAYICNPVDDGMPKAFGQLLPYLRKNGKSVAFDANAGDNFLNATRLNETAAAPYGNSAYITANFHNSPNSITSIQQVIKVTTASGGPIIAGQPNQLILNSAIAGVELVGVLIYGKDQNGVRIGTMTDQGGIFLPFPVCGLNPEGHTVGVIQTMSVAKNGTYTQLWYNAPPYASGSITFQGLGVTNSGFGVYNYTIPVTGTTITCIPVIPSATAALPSPSATAHGLLNARSGPMIERSFQA